VSTTAVGGDCAHAEREEHQHRECDATAQRRDTRTPLLLAKFPKVRVVLERIHGAILALRRFV